MMLEQGKLRGLIISEDPKVSGLLASYITENIDIEFDIIKDLAGAISIKEKRPVVDFDQIILYAPEFDSASKKYIDEVVKDPLHPSIMVIVGENQTNLGSTEFFESRRVYLLKESQIPTLLPTTAEKGIKENPLSSSRLEILKSHALLLRALNTLPDIFAIVDITTKLMIWNKRLEELTGYTPEELETMRVYDLIEESYRETYWKNISEMLEGKEGIGELLLVTKNGQTFPAELRGRTITNERGDIIGFCGTALDISARSKKEKKLIQRLENERRLANERAALLNELNNYLKKQVKEREQIGEELRESKKFFASILENITDYILVVTHEGSLIYTNPVAQSIFGRKPEETDGFALLKAVHPEDLKILLKAWAQIVSTGSLSKPVECRIKHPDGSWRTMEIVGHRFEESSGEQRIIINARDITERKAAEEKLRETSETLRAFLDATSEYAVLFDREGRIIAANKVLASLLGKEVDELVGLKFFEQNLLDPEISRSRSRRVDEVFFTGKPVRFEDFHRGKFFEHRLYPVFGGNGEVEKVAFFSTDITERRRAEEEVKKFQTIQEKANFGIAITSPDGEILYANPYFAELHGFTQKELQGKFLDVFHSEKQMPRVKELLNRLFEEGSFNAEVVWHQKRDGRSFPMLMNGILITDEKGNPVYLATTGVDITELTRTQEALKESEEKYRSYFDNAFDAIFSVDPSFRISSASPSIQNITGFKPEELLGRSFIDLKIISMRSVGSVIDDLVRVMNGEKVTAEYSVCTKSGETKTIEVNESPLFVNGKITGAICTARDITERKQAIEELKRLNKELESYAQTVSHDLKRPLAAIRLSAENLIKLWSMREQPENAQKDREIIRCAEIIQEGVSKANALIDDLLSLAHAGQKPDSVERVDVGALVEDIVYERGALITSRGAEVNFNRDLGRIISSPTHIYQIFSNLIENAIVHNTSEHPRVSIKYLGWDMVKGHHYIVRDNGPGIPPEMREAVLQPLFRGKNGKTGIGLAIVDKIVNLHKGHITIKNRNGTLFEFFIKDLTEE